MVFRHRGIRAVVDTTHIAELQIAGYQLSPMDVEAIARNLAEATFSPMDRLVGPFHIRLLKGYDIAFTLTREVSELVITIFSVDVPDEEETTEAIFRRLNALAVMRSATQI